jgi:hypothetical protein
MVAARGVALLFQSQPIYFDRNAPDSTRSLRKRLHQPLPLPLAERYHKFRMSFGQEIRVVSPGSRALRVLPDALRRMTSMCDDVSTRECQDICN